MSRDFQIDDLVRENIRQLKAYSSARNEFVGEASVYLDANENPFNEPLNRYPDPLQTELKEKLAKLKLQDASNLFLGNGSDEGIDLLYRVFCEPGKDNVVIVEPTYGMYGVCAGINDVEQKKVFLNPDFNLDPRAVLDAVDAATRIIFLCAPNNPTGNAFDRELMLEIINRAPCIVVVDEAYIDFCEMPSLISLVPGRKNLVVLQTLSKAWGLAGARMGMLFAQPAIIHYLNRVKYPYNISSPNIATAIKSLDEDGQKRREWIRVILEERLRLVKELESLACVEKVYPSDANFLLVRVKNPKNIYRELMDKGIIVRDRSSVPLCDGCLRVTVGTVAENTELIEALKSREE